MRLNKSMIGSVLTINNQTNPRPREFHRLTGRLVSYSGGIAEIAAGPYGEVYKYRISEWALERIESPSTIAARALRSVNSPAQQQASRENGKKGGRPRKVT